MNRIFILGVVCFLIFGCEEPTAWSKGELAPSKYQCTSEQLKQVNEEYEICNKSEYLSTYCFAQAKATVCSKMISN